MGYTCTDFTTNGKCSNFGKCCSDFLPMSRREVKRIKAYIKKHHIKEQRHNVTAGIDLTCPFRDEVSRKCLVYAVRPAICQCFMCNHTEEDIMKAKMSFHDVKQVVCLRNEFYGSNEDIEFLHELSMGLAQLQKGG